MYDFDAPGFNTKTRNFTQMVWRETTSIGVAKVRNTDGVTVVVARYYPTANVLGKFEENVLKCTDIPRNFVTVMPQPPENGNYNIFTKRLVVHENNEKCFANFVTKDRFPLQLKTAFHFYCAHIIINSV